MLNPSRALAWIALVAVALLVSLLLLRRGTSRGAAPELERVVASSQPNVTALAELPAEGPRTVAGSEERDSGRAPIAPLDSSTACTVLGRLVDEHRGPLAGVPVRLYGYKGWAEGHDVPRLPGKYDLRGWEVASAADGSFRFEVPVPTVTPTQLRVEPDPFHDSAWLILGGEDADTRAPLRTGVNDLGELLLVVTGAIRGRVTTQAGAPLADAELHIGSEPWNTLGREGTADASGSYRIAHVKPGTYGVAVNCKGYLTAFTKPVLVEAGRFTDGVDFALEVAPVLAGHVVDEEGHGLAAAELQAWPSTSGRGAFGKSDANGSFRLALPVEVPYTLEVELEGFESHGLGRSARYEPGSDDLRIVLRRSVNARTTFVVVDAKTGAPVERFGLEIERDQGSAATNGWTSYRADPTPRHHAGGTLDLAARPGLDRFTVQAPGYLRVTGDVAHAGAGDPRQVVALVAGGTLSGRVSAGGVAAPNASVRLEPGRRKAGGFIPDLDHVFHTTADAAGSFRFDMLDPGDYRLVARADAGLATRELKIPRAGPVDGVELVLAPGATILGRVLAPPGRSPAGLEVYLMPWQLDVKQVTDAAGGFRFDGLAAGEHELLLDERAGVVTSLRERVTVTAGEAREVLLDARGKGTCEVALTLELGRRPAAGLAVFLR